MHFKSLLITLFFCSVSSNSTEQTINQDIGYINKSVDSGVKVYKASTALYGAICSDGIKRELIAVPKQTFWYNNKQIDQFNIITIDGNEISEFEINNWLNSVLVGDVETKVLLKNQTFPDSDRVAKYNILYLSSWSGLSDHFKLTENSTWGGFHCSDAELNTGIK